MKLQRLTIIDVRYDTLQTPQDHEKLICRKKCFFFVQRLTKTIMA